MKGWAGRAEPLLLGHRGGCPARAENSLEAFRCGLEAGADVLETDVRCTADGHFVACHDDNALRVAGVDRKIAEAPLAEVQRWKLTFAGAESRIPTLDEVLVELPDAALNVDMKDHREELVEPLIELIERRDAVSRVLLTSFSSRMLTRVRHLGYPGATGLGRIEALRAAFLPPRWARSGGKRLQIPPRYGPLDLTTSSFIDRMHRRGLKVDYWVINDPDHARALLERGADGIVTDDVAALGDVFRDVLSHRR